MNYIVTNSQYKLKTFLFFSSGITLKSEDGVNLIEPLLFKLNVVMLVGTFLGIAQFINLGFFKRYLKIFYVCDINTNKIDM